jgi:hypothetical protein
MEFTRLDSLVDVMFATATDVEAGMVEAAMEGIAQDAALVPSSAPREWEFTDKSILDSKRHGIMSALALKIGVTLIKKSRALYWDASHEKRVACSISKRYSRGAAYWYAYHPKWDEFLGEAREAYFVLGCVDLAHAFAIPLHVMRQTLDALNTTTTENGKTYWHVHLVETARGIGLVLPGFGHLPLDEYRLPI